MKRRRSSIDILRERENLLARCAAQRDELTVLIGLLDGPIKIADRGIAVARYVRDRPLVLGAVVAVMGVIKRRGLWKWAKRGFVAWRTYRAFGRSSFKSVF